MENESIVTNQYLTFCLGDEDFAVHIDKVREVLDCTTIAKIPRSPAFMRGVTNLRGSVVPVIDLRLCLNMEAAARTVDTCIVIVDVFVDGQTTQLGALADSVQEVLDIEPSQIDPAPKLGTKLNTDFIRGMGKRGDGFVIILDIDKVLSTDDFASAAIAADSSGANLLPAETEDAA